MTSKSRSRLLASCLAAWPILPTSLGAGPAGAPTGYADRETTAPASTGAGVDTSPPTGPIAPLGLAPPQGGPGHRPQAPSLALERLRIGPGWTLLGRDTAPWWAVTRSADPPPQAPAAGPQVPPRDEPPAPGPAADRESGGLLGQED